MKIAGLIRRSNSPAIITFAAALTACTTTHTPPPAIQPAPLHQDPRICAQSEPEPKITGAPVKPATEAERASTEAFLNSFKAWVDWGRAGWSRAEVARRGC